MAENPTSTRGNTWQRPVALGATIGALRCALGAFMHDTATQTPDKKPAGDTARGNPKGKQESAEPPKSRFEKFASTQAGGDGIEGDVLKPDKTIDDKIGANMADRK